jgi:hypothetical protein
MAKDPKQQATSPPVSRCHQLQLGHGAADGRAVGRWPPHRALASGPAWAAGWNAALDGDLSKRGLVPTP